MRSLNAMLGQKGAAALEAAIITPVGLLILFGIIQYGVLLSAHVTLRNASAVAARAAVLDGATTTGIRNAARDALLPPLLTSGLPDSNIAIANVTVNGAAATKVTLTYNFPLMLSFVVPGSLNGEFVLNASTTMR